MKKAVVALFCFFTLLSIGNALQCHLCIGSLNGDCLNAKVSAMANKTCLHIEDNEEDKETLARLWGNKGGQPLDTSKKIVSKCVAVTFHETKSVSPFVERGCGYIYEDTDLCEYVHRVQPEVKDCKACHSDYCNVFEI